MIFAPDDGQVPMCNRKPAPELFRNSYTMADIYRLAKKIFKWEGGFSNDPEDNGGPTMMGVTIATWRTYCKRKGRPAPTVEDLKRITRLDVIDVLRELYWNPCHADLINNQSVADLVVNSCWGSGTGYIKNIQRTLGLKADNIVGPKTIAALNRNPKEVHAKLWEARRVFFSKVCMANPSQKKFLKGWLNRLNDFKYED